MKKKHSIPKKPKIVILFTVIAAIGIGLLSSSKITDQLKQKRVESVVTSLALCPGATLVNSSTNLDGNYNKKDKSA